MYVYCVCICVSTVCVYGMCMYVMCALCVIVLCSLVCMCVHLIFVNSHEHNTTVLNCKSIGYTATKAEHPFIVQPIVL